MAEHTRGPWTYHYSKSDPQDEWFIFGGDAAGNPALGAVMADAESGLAGATVEANARLIAAAPDLLAALTWLHRVHGSTSRHAYGVGTYETTDLHALVTAAIAKAEGRDS